MEFVREGIKIGLFEIHYYGVIIMLGAVLAAWLASKQSARAGENPETVWDFMPWVLIFGIIGARIWHILTPTDFNQSLGLATNYYFTHPLDALDIRNGGLGIPGAVVGGVAALFVYCRKHKLAFSHWLDYLAPGLALAQSIGRWGNFVNQELYGAPTNLPWKLFIDAAHRITGYENVEYYHPLFLYESLFNLLNAGLLFWLSRKKADLLKSGDLFLIYLINYSFARFFLEFIRLDASSIGGINANQTLMAVTFIASVIGLVIKHRKTNTPEIDTAPQP
jgi:phosphatidylglycerol---prolipoprotein diacylglyceryl transferase